MVRRRDLVTTVADHIGVSVDEARQAAEATVATLVRTVDGRQRQQVLDAVPALLTEQVEAALGPAWDEDDFVAEVSWLTGTAPEEARQRAQAVLYVLSRAPDIERDGDTATLTVYTRSVDAVTRLDVELAYRVDDTVASA